MSCTTKKRMGSDESWGASRVATRSGWAALFLFAALPLDTVWAQNAVVGYQLGATQSVGTTIGNNLDVLVPAGDTEDLPSDPVNRLEGIALSTTVNGALSLDFITSTLSHGLVFGANFTQLWPVGVPDAAPQALVDRLSQAQLTTAYLGRLVRPLWGIAFGANYSFDLNGRLGGGSDGSIQSGGGGAGASLPGAQVGSFVINNQTHNLGANVQLEVTRPRWDFAIGASYGYTQNGLFSLSAGTVGQPQSGGTNIGSFVPATVHTLSPSATYRTRFDRRNAFSANLASTYSIPLEAEDDVQVIGIDTTIIPATVPPPETLNNTLTLQYLHTPDRFSSFGLEASGSISFRVASDEEGLPLVDAALSKDTAIGTVRVFYSGRIAAAELEYTLGAGVAQGYLFQRPLGAGVVPDDLFPLHSSIQPVGDFQLRRRFNPVDLSLTGARRLGVGAFGASAVIEDSAALTLSHATRVFGKPLATTAGFNVNRTEGLQRDRFVFDNNANNQAAIAVNSLSAGAELGFAMPLYTDRGFAVDAILTYNFSWSDTDPDGVVLDNRNPACQTVPPGPDCTTIPTITTHTALFVLQATFGRGSLQRAGGVGGARETDALDVYSQVPGSGAALVSSQILNPGASALTGTQGRRPGEPIQERRDSAPVYNRQKRQAQERTAGRQEKPEPKTRQPPKKRAMPPLWPMLPPSDQPNKDPSSGKP